jgi:nitrate/nitrite transporter NarK
MRKDRIVSVTLTVICQSFQALSMGGISLLLPYIREDMGLTFAQGGSLAAVTTIIYALLQIPSGYLSDRFSPKRLFIIGILGTTVLTLTLGLVQNYQQALVNQALTGVFRSFLFVPGMALLTGWFSSERRAAAIGLNTVGGMSGSVLFNLVAPIIVMVTSWRIAFISVALLGISVSLLLLKFGKESPIQPSRSRGGKITEVLSFFASRVMWVCGGIQFIRLATLYGITYWLPSLLVYERGLSVQEAGFIMTIQAVLIAPSNVLGGYISDKTKKPIMVITFSLFILGLTSVLLVSTGNIVFTIFFIVLNAVFLQMYSGTLFSIPIEIFGVRKAGLLSGFGNFFANVGGFLTTYSLGVVKDISGEFRFGFYFIAGLCLIGLILTTILAKMRSSRMKHGELE